MESVFGLGGGADGAVGCCCCYLLKGQGGHATRGVGNRESVARSVPRWRGASAAYWLVCGPGPRRRGGAQAQRAATSIGARLPPPAELAPGQLTVRCPHNDY